MYKWIGPHGPLELKNDEIHLWRADLDPYDMSALPAFTQTLAPEERKKAGALRSVLDRNRYILARAALRNILARYLQTTPDELVFRYGPRGKPELAGGAVRFSVSHSHRFSVYAISRASDVGVDVERVRPGIEEDVAGSFFSIRALRYLKALPQPARGRAFFQGWVRMEACSKACGEGLTSSLETLDLFLAPRAPLLLSTPDNAEESSAWWLQDFFPRRGYVAALAARGWKRKLKYWTWQADRVGGKTI